MRTMTGETILYSGHDKGHHSSFALVMIDQIEPNHRQHHAHGFTQGM